MLKAFDAQGVGDDHERLEAALSNYGRLVNRMLRTPVMTLEGAAIQLRLIVDDQLDPERYLPDLATRLEEMDLSRQ